MPHDTRCRVSYLLGIHKALQIFYADVGLADGWLKRPNQAFGGQSALERMLAGDVADRAAVRVHLDAARGGWRRASRRPGSIRPNSRLSGVSAGRLGVFRPKAVGIPTQGRHLQYHWDGSRVSRYFDYADEHRVAL